MGPTAPTLSPQRGHPSISRGGLKASHRMQETDSNVGTQELASLKLLPPSKYLPTQQKCAELLRCALLKRGRLKDLCSHTVFSPSPSLSPYTCVSGLSFLLNNIGINVYVHSSGIRPNPLHHDT